MTTPTDQLRCRIVQALASYDLPYFSATRQTEVADVVLAVLRRATQPEIKAATLSTTTAPDEVADLRAELDKLIRWHKEDGDQAAKMRTTITRLRAERTELGRQLDCIRGDMRDMESHVREQDAEFERLRHLADEQPETEGFREWLGRQHVAGTGIGVRQETEAPAPARLPHMKPLAVSCPLCHAPANCVCVSHGGTRPRFHDVHQARTAAYRAQATP